MLLLLLLHGVVAVPVASNQRADLGSAAS